ncbi:hypothetical protein [Pseudomonas phage Astolliot]|nr:hypothetical protein [Pseudomonas phage Astolliot]
MIRGMAAAFALPTMIHGESYHTRKHGVSVYKGMTLDKNSLMFLDKNGMIQIVGKDFNSLVTFLATNRVTKMGENTDNAAMGIGL